MSIKCFFGCHDIDITKRVFVGRDKIYENAGGMITVDEVYIFRTESICFRCNKTFKGKQKILWFDLIKQPYDVNFEEIY